MIFTKKEFLIVFFALLLTASCALEKKAATSSKIVSDELIFTYNPAPMDKKTDVYMSMARAVKYNADEQVKNMKDKLKKLNLNDVLDKKEKNKLYEASRVLDFAIIKAAYHLFENEKIQSDYLYEKMAENLSLAAISAHKNALFAEKKAKEAERLENTEKRRLAELEKKQQRRGELNADEADYKSEIEAALFNLNNFKKKVYSLREEYALLVKAERMDFSLEGRRFYELENFNEKYQVDTFQRMAMKRRFECKFMNDAAYPCDYDTTAAETLAAYPQLDRLLINGYDINNPKYAENLQSAAIKAATALNDSLESYQIMKKGDEKEVLRKKAIRQLAVAEFIQIRTDFDIVRQADFDYQQNIKALSLLKKEIVEINKIYRMNYKNKIRLLNLKIKQLNLELEGSQIQAERAFALRALYFNAGLTPFTRGFLTSSEKEMSRDLKSAFNGDMAEMLSQYSDMALKPKNPEKGWAKGDNWLENLVDKPEKKINSDLSNNFIYEGERFNRKKVLQLGSYKERKNIETEWVMLQELFPELKAYTPRIEKTRVGGEPYYRLVVQSANGGLKDLCNKIRNNHMDCLLR